ncbi:MAG TPA: GPP34 family phosphoprotein [Vicinamibacterales bacterium]|nr:GPP34 family phosphoprotein [Vicinamibacterales bacterium]
MLTLLEEVVLLTIDPATGRLRGDRQSSVPYGLVGALLFDLALAGRIDTDVDSISVLNDTPTGNHIQDELLADLSGDGAPVSVRGCVEQTFRLRSDLEARALAQLVERGIIRHETSRRLWVIDVHRFPLVDGKPQQFVKDRLAHAILSDDIPPARDIMLVSLANACGLLTGVVTDEQRANRAQRIQALSNLETIARNVSHAVAGLYGDLARGVSGAF